MLLREIKRDSNIDSDQEQFKNECELIDKISEICLREAKSEQNFKPLIEHKLSNRQSSNTSKKYKKENKEPKKEAVKDYQQTKEDEITVTALRD